MLQLTLIPSILAYLGEGQTTILKLRSYYKETAFPTTYNLLTPNILFFFFDSRSFFLHTFYIVIL